MPPTGIDTIYLRCRNFSIRDKPSLRLLPPKKRGSPKCHLWSTATHKVYGSEAFWEGEGIFVQLHCPYEGARDPDCIVQITVPTVLYGNNAKVVDEDEFLGAITEAQKILAGVGIVTDLFGAQPVRLDVCRNISLPRQPRKYVSVFEHWKLKYARRTQLHDNGLSSGNKSMQFICYDKRKELRIKAGIPEGSLLKALGEADLLSEHTMRLEYRLLNAKRVREAFDLNQLTANPQGIAKIYGTLGEWLDDQQRSTMGTQSILHAGVTDPLKDFFAWWQETKLAIQDRQAKPEDIFTALGFHSFKMHFGDEGLAELQTFPIPESLSPISNNDRQNAKRRINALEAKRAAWVAGNPEQALLLAEICDAIAQTKSQPANRNFVR